METKFVFVTLFSIVCVVAAQKKPVNLDKVPIDQILKNERVLDSYISCLLDKRNCTEVGKELKKILPDAIQNDCSQCTALQKRNLKKVITTVRTNRPQEWAKLLEKYDPQGVFQKRQSWY